MFCLLIIGLCAGIEVGWNQPVSGFDYNLNSGVGFRIFADQELGFAESKIFFDGEYYQGKNSSYVFNIYGIGIQFTKSGWRFAPFMEAGVDYISRELNKNKEWGIGAFYSFGFLINFNYESVNIYPAFYYTGVTDIRLHSGFLGVKLGIGYEF